MEPHLQHIVDGCLVVRDGYAILTFSDYDVRGQAPGLTGRAPRGRGRDSGSGPIPPKAGHHETEDDEVSPGPEAQAIASGHHQ